MVTAAKGSFYITINAHKTNFSVGVTAQHPLGRSLGQLVVSPIFLLAASTNTSGLFSLEK